MLSLRRIAFASASAFAVAAAVVIPVSASAADGGAHSLPNCPTSPDVVYRSSDCLPIQVTTVDGIHAGVKIPDLLCARVDALAHDKTADARVRIPCPPAGFKNCKEAEAAGAHDIPASSPLYRKWLDEDNDGIACESDVTPVDVTPAPVDVTPAPVAQAPRTVITHLPVTH